MGLPSLGKPSAPTAQSMESAQNQSNQNAELLNSEYSKYNTSNPYGSVSWAQSGTNADGTPIYTQTTSLSPVEQGIFNSQTANQQNALNKGGAVLANWTNNGGLNFNPQLQPLTYSAGQAAQAGLGNFTTNIGNGGEAVQLGLNGPNPTQLANESSNAAYQNQMGYLTPQFQNQQSDLNAQLAAQGISQGSDAWNRAQGDLSRNQTFQQQQAQSSAFNQGLNEESQLYGQELNTGNFNNAAQQQQYGQAMGNADLQNQQAQAATQLSEFNAGQANSMAQFNAQLNNNAVNQNLSNDISIANEPLQEYGALTNGATPQIPAAGYAPTVGGIGVNMADAMTKNYANQLNAYNGNMSGLGGMLSMFNGGSAPNTPFGSVLNGFGGLFGGGGGGSVDPMELLGGAMAGGEAGGVGASSLISGAADYAPEIADAFAAFA